MQEDECFDYSDYPEYCEHDCCVCGRTIHLGEGYYHTPKYRKCWCMDCAFIAGYITEKDYLFDNFPLGDRKQHAAVKDGKIVLWNGKTSPWERKEKQKQISKVRTSKDYIKWRWCVLVRDNFTCQKCGDTPDSLHAHHIKPFATFPDLRFEVSNGITYCQDCHNNIKRS